VSGTRTIIVTGASSGIGRELARLAVRNGWDVIATGRRAERIDELVRESEGGPGTLHGLALDLRAPGAAARIVRFAQEKTGRIDVLANVAGSASFGDVIDQTDDQLREQFEVHAVVPVALAREARAALAKTRGLVMFVGSGVARVPMGGFGAYSGAKAAIRSLSRTLRLELRKDDIAVTYVDPGVIKTEFHSRLGYAGPPEGVAVTPEFVAARMFGAILKRPRELNAVPLQTLASSLGQLAPRLTDELMLLAPDLFGITPAPAQTVVAHEPSEAPEPAATTALNGTVVTSRNGTPTADPLEAALAPLSNRMSRQKLTLDFIRSLLEPGAELDLSGVAQRWAGMPNKNERAITRDVLEALAEAGLLTRSGEFAYRVPGDATHRGTYVS
jgi:serine 3-dehydrogenase